MITRVTKKALKKLGVALMSLTLILSFLAVSLPQPVKAATDTVACDTYYTVKSGDTLRSIAQAYGLKWRDLAEANNIKSPYKVKVGQKLCIPASENPETDNLTLTVSVTGSNISVKAYSSKYAYKYGIKVRAGDTGVGGWYKVGNLRVPKKTTVTGVYALPKDLKTVSPITVCLKNQSTDNLICRTVIHF
jgi:LysM repeat protein